MNFPLYASKAPELHSLHGAHGQNRTDTSCVVATNAKLRQNIDNRNKEPSGLRNYAE